MRIWADMIYLISGPVNRGKTTRLRGLFEAYGGDGLLCPKAFVGREYAGQNITRLLTGECRPFSRRDGFAPPGWDEGCRYDRYVFSASALDFAHDSAREMVRAGATPIFFDEVGPLELRSLGLARPFRLLLAAGRDMYVVVREECVFDVTTQFGIDQFCVLT